MKSQRRQRFWMGQVGLVVGALALSASTALPEAAQAQAVRAVEVSVDAHNGEVGDVHGRVTDTQGAPIANVEVKVTGPGGVKRTGKTGADGTYLIENLPAGGGLAYAVSFEPTEDAPFLPSRFVQPGNLSGHPSYFYIQSGTVTSGIDGTLPAAYRVSGRVAPESGDAGQCEVGVTPVGDIEFEPSSSGEAAGDGSYTSSKLAAGKYMVWSQCSPKQGSDQKTSWARTFYGQSRTQLQPHVVELPGKSSNIDVTVLPSSKVTGRVVDDVTGKAVAGIRVNVLADAASTAITAADGTYEIQSVGGLTTVARFVDPKNNYPTQYSDGSFRKPVSRTVEVGFGATLDQGVTKLSRGGTIKGQVTHDGTGTLVGSKKIELRPLGEYREETTRSVPLAADGSFTYEHAPLTAVQLCLVSQDTVFQCLHDVVPKIDGAVVTPKANETVHAPAFPVRLGMNVLRGSVRMADMRIVPAKVEVVDLQGRVWGSTFVLADGPKAMQFEGVAPLRLPSGQFKLRVLPTDGSFAPQWYHPNGGVFDEASAASFNSKDVIHMALRTDG